MKAVSSRFEVPNRQSSLGEFVRNLIKKIGATGGGESLAKQVQMCESGLFSFCSVELCSFL